MISIRHSQGLWIIFFIKLPSVANSFFFYKTESNFISLHSGQHWYTPQYLKIISDQLCLLKITVFILISNTHLLIKVNCFLFQSKSVISSFFIYTFKLLDPNKPMKKMSSPISTPRQFIFFMHLVSVPTMNPSSFSPTYHQSLWFLSICPIKRIPSM